MPIDTNYLCPRRYGKLKADQQRTLGKGIPHSRSSGRATQGGGHNTTTVGGAVQVNIKGGTLGGG
jgi:hypothetical protein